MAAIMEVSQAGSLKIPPNRMSAGSPSSGHAYPRSQISRPLRPGQAEANLVAEAVQKSGQTSIFHSRQTIQAGDLVIVYVSRDSLIPVTIIPGEELHNKYGRYNHDNMIGQRFGTKMLANTGKGYIHLLRPSPELWTFSLPHRTQILYMADIAFVMEGLGVRVGGRVVEAGTGSGSMSHSLAQTLGPMGKLFSFEYHATRYEKALIEFESHGLADRIELKHRNVCKEGFGENAVDVDAVFLDLPAPWDAIPHARKALRTDISTKICCFSPCMEQVMRTVTALDAEGFTDIAMYEVLSRQHELALPIPRFRTVSSVSSKLKKHSVKKEKRRQMQMRNSKQRKKVIEATGEAGGRREEEEEEEGRGVKRIREDDDAMEASLGNTKRGEKRLKSDDVAMEEEEALVTLGAAEVDAGEAAAEVAVEPSIPSWLLGPERTTPPNTSTPEPTLEEQIASDEDEDSDSEDEHETFQLPKATITKPMNEMRGHTSYLTFANLIPISVRMEMEEWENTKVENRNKRNASGNGNGNRNGDRIIPVQVNGKILGIKAVQVEQGITSGTQESLLSVTDTSFASQGMGQMIASMTEEQLQALTRGV